MADAKDVWLQVLVWALPTHGIDKGVKLAGLVAEQFERYFAPQQTTVNVALDGKALAAVVAPKPEVIAPKPEEVKK